jgi:hypothetical protein
MGWSIVLPDDQLPGPQLSRRRNAMKEKHTDKASAEDSIRQSLLPGRQFRLDARIVTFTGTVWTDATFIRIVIGSMAWKRVAPDPLKINSSQTRLTFPHRQATERDDFSNEESREGARRLLRAPGMVNAGGQGRSNSLHRSGQSQDRRRVTELDRFRTADRSPRNG